MSLFGDDEETKPSRTGSASLFADAKPKSAGGIFGDDSDPWIPTPKKKKNPAQLLADCDIPDYYIDTYDQYSTNSRVSRAALNELISNAHISKAQHTTIDSLIQLEDDHVSRHVFNLVLVLLALSQQNEELSLDTVDDLKSRKLPIPKLSDRAMSEPAPANAQSSSERTPSEPQQTTLDQYLVTEPSSKASNGSTGHDSHTPSRKADLHDPWSPNGSTHATSYNEQESRPSASTYVSSPNIISSFDADAITITALENKEGLPLWKHINYEVKSEKRKSSVVRRYSDFAWLLDCLLRKYPFRQVPLLPPKKVAGMNLTGKSADLSFLEKRRRGLSRFANALERHPVFKSDQLVTTFLTVPTELAVWRKQASITVTEEFDDRYLPAELEAGLPQGIEEWMSKTQASLKNAIDCFTQLTTLQERIVKRQELDCIDYLRFGSSLSFFAEQESSSFAVLGKENGPGIMRGLQSIAKYHTNAQSLMLAECRAWEDNYLEDLKRYRGLLASINELFLRHARYSPDNVPTLEKRISTTTAKLETLQAKQDAKPTDIERLKASIEADKQAIVKAMNRRVFIRECVWHELQFFEAQQIHITKLATTMATTRLDFAKKYVDVASTLVGDVEGMP